MYTLGVSVSIHTVGLTIPGQMMHSASQCRGDTVPLQLKQIFTLSQMDCSSPFPRRNPFKALLNWSILQSENMHPHGQVHPTLLDMAG